MTAILVIPGTIVALDVASAAFNPIPTLVLSLSPTSQQANVSPVDDAYVTFYGNATVDKLPTPLQRVTVTLEASSMYETAIEPSTMVFTASGSQSFAVKVIVPSRTHSFMICQLLVNGNAKAPGMPVAMATTSALITMSQYFGLEARVVGGTFAGLRAGSVLNGTLRVSNTGNGLDTVAIELLDPSWTVSSSHINQTAEVGPEKSVELPFTLRVVDDLPGDNWSRAVAFKCTSSEACDDGLEVSKVAWFNLVFNGTVPSSGDGAVHRGDDGEGDRMEEPTKEPPKSFPTSLIIIILILILLLAVILLALRGRGARRTRSGAPEAHTMSGGARQWSEPPVAGAGRRQ